MRFLLVFFLAVTIDVTFGESPPKSFNWGLANQNPGKQFFVDEKIWEKKATNLLRGENELNVLAKKSEEILGKGGKLILLTAEVNIQQAIQNAGLIELLPYYQKETDLLLASMEAAGVTSENKATAEISTLNSQESLASPEEISEEFPEYYGAKHSSNRLFFLLILLILATAYGSWYLFG